MGSWAESFIWMSFWAPYNVWLYFFPLHLCGACMLPIDDDVITDTRLVWCTLKAAWVGFVSCVFLNTTFTVGPSSQAQRHQQMGAYDPAPGGFIFIPLSHPLLAAAPTAQRLMPKNHLRHSKNENIQADGRVSAYMLLEPALIIKNTSRCYMTTVTVLKSLRNRELHSETVPSNKPSKSL